MNAAKQRAMAVLTRELARLERQADSAKAKVEEVVNISGELNACWLEINHISSLDIKGSDRLKRRAKVEERREKALKILGQDLSKLMDKQFEAEDQVAEFRRVLDYLSFYLARSQGNHV